MSKISLVIILLLQAGMTFAQKYFAFIGSENRQPFYVRVDSEFHPSTAEGHLILSQLNDGAYNITIGFPGQTLPEQHYSFAMHSRDQAFELRSQGQDGLRLYDLQGNEWLSSQGGGGVGDVARSTGVKKDDAFSRMMAGVVQDTAVLYNTYAMEQALSGSPATAAVKTGSVAIPPAPASSAPADTTNTATSTRPDSAANSAGLITSTPATSPATMADTSRLTSPTVPLTDSTHTAAPIVKSAAPGDTTTAAAASPVATAPPATSAGTPTVAASDTTISHAAGVITHEPAPRFTDSGSIPLYRPIPKDTTAGAAPIPKLVGSPLYRTATGVVKVSEKHGTKNVRLVYTDRSGGKKADTIVVIIPMDSPVAKTPVRQPRGDSTHVPGSRAHGPNTDSPALSTGIAGRPALPATPPAEAPRGHTADTTRRPTKAIPFVNSDCHDFATDYDVDKLRVKMLESARDDDRVSVARKTFKIKCFSTRQIRTLSEVFTSDAAKFRFFEAAWPFAADEHFHELSELLADPVYNSKFKTMTHQQ